MTHGLTYVQTGTGPETIVFLHGIGADASSFHHQTNAFPEYRCIAWNMPGYQGSRVDQTPPSFDHLSDRLAALTHGAGGPVHLVGQSIGGMLALHHTLKQPSQISTLTLIATTPRFGGRDDSFKTAFLKARLDPLDAGLTMAEMATKTAPHLVGPDTPKSEVARIATALAQVPQDTWRGILHCLVTFDRADDLAQVPCPTLVVAGSADQNAPAPTMQKMAAKIPGARFHLMQGAGHMLHQEQPQLFNRWLAEFLKDTAPCP